MSKTLKTLKDGHEDQLEIDTSYAAIAYLTTMEPSTGTGTVFAANPAQVKKIRKQLKKWLVENGHEV